MNDTLIMILLGPLCVTSLHQEELVGGLIFLLKQVKEVALFTNDFCVVYQEGVRIPPREKQDRLNAYMSTHD
jgi:hypothetical protein